MKNYQPRLCIICETEYVPTAPRQKVCPNPDCRYSQKKRRDAESAKRRVSFCKRCGDPTPTYASKYCTVCFEIVIHAGFPTRRAPKTERTCEQCGKTFYVKESEIQPERGSPRRFCSVQCYQDVRVTWTGENSPKYQERVMIECDTCGELFGVVPRRATTARYCSVTCLNSGNRVSAQEGIVANELEQRKILYDAQIHLGRFYPDFIVGQTVIEVDGDYWHTIPRVVEKDVRKDAFYQENGFNVIHIWEHEVNAGDFSKLDALCA